MNETFMSGAQKPCLVGALQEARHQCRALVDLSMGLRNAFRLISRRNRPDDVPETFDLKDDEREERRQT